MTNSTKLKVRKQNGKIEVLVLVNHPMETGQRQHKTTKEPVSAHYIQTMTIELNGKAVAEANLGPGVAKNPLMGIELDGARSGDKFTARWIDNKGQSGFGEAMVE